MNIKVTLDLGKLKTRLCQDCQKKLDDYLKELAIEALQQEESEAGGNHFPPIGKK